MRHWDKEAVIKASSNDWWENTTISCDWHALDLLAVGANILIFIIDNQNIDIKHKLWLLESTNKYILKMLNIYHEMSLDWISKEDFIESFKKDVRKKEEEK